MNAFRNAIARKFIPNIFLVLKICHPAGHRIVEYRGNDVLNHKISVLNENISLEICLFFFLPTQELA